MPHLPEDLKDKHVHDELIPDVPPLPGMIERISESALRLSTSQDGFGSLDDRVTDTPITGTGRSRGSQLETLTGYLRLPQASADRHTEICAGVNTDKLLEADKLLKSFNHLGIIASK